MCVSSVGQIGWQATLGRRKGQGSTESSSLRQGMSPSTISWHCHVQAWASTSEDPLQWVGEPVKAMHAPTFAALHICTLKITFRQVEASKKCTLLLTVLR